MAENKMAEVAKLLGIELEEEFKIDGFRCKYKLTNDGLMYWSYLDSKWLISNFYKELLTGEVQIIKIPKSILDDIEKKYLSSIIKPFRNKVEWIKKISNFEYRNFEYIKIRYQDNDHSMVLNFPDFKVGTMYRGMKIDKAYTLKELGL